MPYSSFTADRSVDILCYKKSSPKKKERHPHPRIRLLIKTLSIATSCNKEVDVEWVETIHRADSEREPVINDKEDIQRIRENLLELKSESYIAFFDLLIEEQYTDPVKTAEMIRSDKTLSMLDKMILVELIDYSANSVELRSSSGCEWKRKKRIVALAAKCTWDICTGRDADDIVNDATEELKDIRQEYQECIGAQQVSKKTDYIVHRL